MLAVFCEDVVNVWRKFVQDLQAVISNSSMRHFHLTDPYSADSCRFVVAHGLARGLLRRLDRRLRRLPLPALQRTARTASEAALQTTAFPSLR